MSKPNETHTTRNIESLLSKYTTRYFSTNASPSDESTILQEGANKPVRFLALLRILPWALSILFILSFIWDFDQLSLKISGAGILLESAADVARNPDNSSTLSLSPFLYIVQLEGLLITISACGLIGFFTNWLALSMLFRPRQERPIFGQGIVPAQRVRIIHRLSLAISEELISEEVIKERIRDSGVVPRYRSRMQQFAKSLLSDTEFRSDIKALAQKYVRDMLGDPKIRRQITRLVMEKLDEIGGIALKAYRKLNQGKLEQQIEDSVAGLPESADFLMEELDRTLDTLPEKIAARSEEIEKWLAAAIMSFISHLNIYETVFNNMHRYDERRLESLIRNSSNDQLNYIKYLGGALGLIGGIVVFDKWLAITVLIPLFGSLILLDMLLLWVRARQGSQ